jgi:hypothetical protein
MEYKSLRSLENTTYEEVVLAKKPIAYWRLGEGSGESALDRSNNGHTGTYHGTPAYKEKGAIEGDSDTSIRLDGKHSYIEIPSHQDFSQPTSGNGLSVEVWVRPDVLDFPGENDKTYIHWLGKGDGGRQEWALRFYNQTLKEKSNRISAYIFNPEGKLGAGAYFQDTDKDKDKLIAGEWIHVVACFDPGTSDTEEAGVSIYKNGVLRLGPPTQSVLYNHPYWKIKPVAKTAPLRLGTQDKMGFLIGAIDEVAIYPRVLTAEEIFENYQIGMGQ